MSQAKDNQPENKKEENSSVLGSLIGLAIGGYLIYLAIKLFLA